MNRSRKVLRGIVRREGAILLGAPVLKIIVEAVDRSAGESHTDRSKFLRGALEEKIARREKQAVRCSSIPIKRRNFGATVLLVAANATTKGDICKVCRSDMRFFRIGALYHLRLSRIRDAFLASQTFSNIFARSADPLRLM
jgi:hypothetical protein